MKLTQVLGRTWAVEGSGMIGLYRLDGRRCVLLDSGERWEREPLAALLDGAGLVPAGVLSSHIHSDHSINNSWLRRRYGCQVAVPAGEAHLCRSALALKDYLYCYSPGTLDRERGDMVCPPDCTVPSGDGSFSFCGADFRIIHTPGHSPDHLSIITPDHVCYTGDAVFSGEMLSAKLPYAFYLAGMLASAPRLKGLDCGAYIVPHRGIHRELDPLVDGTCQLIRRRADEILALADRPMSREELWRAVISRFELYSSHPLHAALLERNFHSFLDYLVDTGALAVTAQRGLLLYRQSGPNEAVEAKSAHTEVVF